MRILRIIVFTLFSISVALFGYYEVNKLINTDKSVPIITGSKEVLEVNCDYSEKELLKGLKARDDKDGDLTDEIIVGNISRFISKGKSKITYVVFDSSNHPGKFEREVVFKDYHSPHFALSKPLVFKVGSNENVYDLVGAKDVFDGDISAGVTADCTDVNLSEEGKYEIKVSVTNSLGDMTETKLPVHVINSSNMSLNIELKENIVYISKGEKFDPRAMVNNVYQLNGSKVGTGGMKITSNVNTKKSGIYEVRYSLKKEGIGNAETWLTVIVD